MPRVGGGVGVCVPAGSGTGSAGAHRSAAAGYVKVPASFPPASIHFAARGPTGSPMLTGQSHRHGSPTVMAEPPARQSHRHSSPVVTAEPPARPLRAPPVPAARPVAARFWQRQSPDTKVMASVILHFAGHILRISGDGAAAGSDPHPPSAWGVGFGGCCKMAAGSGRRDPLGRDDSNLTGAAPGERSPLIRCGACQTGSACLGGRAASFVTSSSSFSLLWSLVPLFNYV